MNQKAIFRRNHRSKTSIGENQLNLLVGPTGKDNFGLSKKRRQSRKNPGFTRNLKRNNTRALEPSISYQFTEYYDPDV